MYQRLSNGGIPENGTICVRRRGGRGRSYASRARHPSDGGVDSREGAYQPLRGQRRLDPGNGFVKSHRALATLISSREICP
jgi:hypothetical protein